MEKLPRTTYIVERAESLTLMAFWLIFYIFLKNGLALHVNLTQTSCQDCKTTVKRQRHFFGSSFIRAMAFHNFDVQIPHKDVWFIFPTDKAWNQTRNILVGGSPLKGSFQKQNCLNSGVDSFRSLGLYIQVKIHEIL